MQFHPTDHGALVNTAAAAGFGDHPPLPHVAQRSRRDKLRFPFVADAGAMLPSPYGYDDDAAFPPPLPPEPSYVARVSASAADLGYLHAVVAPPPRPTAGEQWPTAQYDASGPWTWARPKVEHDEDEARTGLAAHQGAAALSLTLQSPAPQELPPAYGGSLQSVVGAAAAPAPAGPLGPFTGYAAVLNGSRFLRPAQQLLDEICAALLGAERSRWSAGAGGTCSLASPSSLSSSTDTGDRQYQRPEFREKKTKLLYMQEEVCRRYKQYHQQMQMVMSSFESVPGLSSATPYASFVLKAISKHFRRVRSVLSSQIRYISRLLGEELLSLPSCSRGSKAVARLGLTEQSQPVWRPQRGLPERAVSVLRAWLFDHFLHPYPTDADKHMLATQTGLSRNQVSNWFINARVRLWKPMVEEIHMLETRGSASTNAAGAAACSSDRVATPVAVGVGSHHHHHQHQYQLLQEQQCLDHAPRPMGGQVMMSLGGAAPTADMGGGFGGAAAVSLTLGLRRDVSYQQYYQQQFGGHILGDLVG